MVKNKVNGHSEALKKPETKDNSVPEKKRQIKIAEVEEDSESEENNESQEEKKPLPSTQDETVASKKTEPSLVKPQVKPFELPKDISEAKDQAIKLYSAGNYGEARDKFTTAIDKLTDLTGTLLSDYLIWYNHK